MSQKLFFGMILSFAFSVSLSAQNKTVRNAPTMSHALSQMEREANMTEAQATEMKNLYQAYIASVKEIRADKSLDHSARTDAFAAALASYESKVQAILNDEQYAHYKQLQYWKKQASKKGHVSVPEKQ